MNIAIIDDEPALGKLAKHTITEYGKKHNIEFEIDIYSSGEEFLEAYCIDKYSIIFMDIYMPGLSGIDTALKLRESDTQVAIIFLTTSESHMKNALSCHAFDYLIKPATQFDFHKVLHECITMLNDKGNLDEKYIDFKSAGVNIHLGSNHILYISSSGHNVIIVTIDGSEYISSDNFSTLYSVLSTCKNMLLLNRGILVNMDYIDHFDDGDCYLTDGTVFGVKVKGKKEIRQTYENYKLSTLKS